MNAWATLWQAVFVIGVGAFAIMAVWVTIQGARDIRFLLRTLREKRPEDPDRADGRQ